MGMLNDNAHTCRCSFKSRLYPVTVIYKMYRNGTHLYMLCDNYSQISYKTFSLLFFIWKMNLISLIFLFFRTSTNSVIVQHQNTSGHLTTQLTRVKTVLVHVLCCFEKCSLMLWRNRNLFIEERNLQFRITCSAQTV